MTLRILFLCAFVAYSTVSSKRTLPLSALHTSCIIVNFHCRPHSRFSHEARTSGGFHARALFPPHAGKQNTTNDATIRHAQVLTALLRRGLEEVLGRWRWREQQGKREVGRGRWTPLQWESGLFRVAGSRGEFEESERDTGTDPRGKRDARKQTKGDGLYLQKMKEVVYTPPLWRSHKRKKRSIHYSVFQECSSRVFLRILRYINVLIPATSFPES